jgi:hypothetical protein
VKKQAVGYGKLDIELLAIDVISRKGEPSGDESDKID